MGILSPVLTDLIEYLHHIQVQAEIKWVTIDSVRESEEDINIPILVSTAPMGNRGNLSQTIFVDFAAMFNGKFDFERGPTKEQEKFIDHYLFSAKEIKLPQVRRIEYVFLLKPWVYEENFKRTWVDVLEQDPRIGLKYVRSSGNPRALFTPTFKAVDERPYRIYVLPEIDPPFSTVKSPKIAKPFHVNVRDGGDIYAAIKKSSSCAEIQEDAGRIFARIIGTSRRLVWEATQAEPMVDCTGHVMPLFMESHTIKRMIHFSAHLAYAMHELADGEYVEIPVFIDGLDAVRCYATCNLLSEYAEALKLSICVRYATSKAKSLLRFFFEENTSYVKFDV